VGAAKIMGKRKKQDSYDGWLSEAIIEIIVELLGNLIFGD
jgi:hypothetical protein